MDDATKLAYDSAQKAMSITDSVQKQKFIFELQMHCWSLMCKEMIEHNAARPLPIKIYDPLQYSNRKNLMSFIDFYDLNMDLYFGTVSNWNDLVLDAQLYARCIAPVNDIDFIQSVYDTSFTHLTSVAGLPL